MSGSPWTVPQIYCVSNRQEAVAFKPWLHSHARWEILNTEEVGLSTQTVDCPSCTVLLKTFGNVPSHPNLDQMQYSLH
jgi:hypothetical protein